jgi:2-methylisocitrate lyase-like PEP mutase family enzyme
MTNEEYAARRSAFRGLHESGCFVMPNPWDAGSARYLGHLGFQAVATTSAGFAFSRGLPDSQEAVTVEMALTHALEIAAAVPMPVNADFQAGYAADTEGVAANVKRCCATGVAGLSIEDATGDRTRPLYDLEEAVERVRAARAAIDESGGDVLLTARAECYLTGHPQPLKEAIRRLQAYAEAGADVLYAPGVEAAEEIRSMVDAVRPRPVNVLMCANTGLRVADLAELGVRRISVGSALARAAWTGWIRAARGIMDNGCFAGFDGLTSFGELNEFFSR